jgi:alpha-N-arabinofuranosidase
MYGGWQLGNVPVERYALRHNAFVDAMKAVDPSIKTIAVGNPGKWNDVILPACAGHMDLLSGHHYTERKFRLPMSADDARKYEEDFLAYSGRVTEGLRGIVTDFRGRLGRSAEVDRVRLSIDEWGIVREWNPAPDASGVGAYEHYYCVGDAVAVARAMNEMLRSADVVGLGNWPQTVNVIGAIKTTRNHAAMDPVGHVLALYRARVNGVLAPISVSAGATVDAVAGLDANAGAVGVALVNFSPNQGASVTLSVKGLAKAPSSSTAWRINGPSLTATNIPGQPEAVTTTQLPEPIALDKPIALPAHSITVLEIRLK